MFTGDDPNKERTGLVVSTTLTVLIKVVAEFPEESITSYDISYDPRTAVLTDPVVEIFDEIALLSS